MIEQLSNIDKTNLSKFDIEEITKLVDEIKKISNNTPNEVDEYVTKKKETINNLIKKIEQIPKDDTNSEFLNRQLDNLKQDFAREMDSYER